MDNRNTTEQPRESQYYSVPQDVRSAPPLSAPMPVSYAPGGGRHHDHEFAAGGSSRRHAPPLTVRVPQRLNKSLSMPGQHDVNPHSAPVTRTARPAVSRAHSVREVLSNQMGTFFGLSLAKNKSDTGSAVVDEKEAKHSNHWKARRLRHCSRRYGLINDPTPVTPTSSALDDFPEGLVTPQIGQLPAPMRAASDMSQGSVSIRSTAASARHPAQLAASIQSLNRSHSAAVSASTPSASVRVVERRDSVAKMAWDGITTLLTKGAVRPRESYASSQRKHRLRSHSFTPGSLDADDNSVFESFDQDDTDFGEANLAASYGSSMGASLREACTPMETIDEEASRKGSSTALRLAEDTGEDYIPMRRLTNQQPHRLSVNRPDSLEVAEPDLSVFDAPDSRSHHAQDPGQRYNQQSVPVSQVQVDVHVVEDEQQAASISGDLHDDVFFDLSHSVSPPATTRDVPASNTTNQQAAPVLPPRQRHKQTPHYHVQPVKGAHGNLHFHQVAVGQAPPGFPKRGHRSGAGRPPVNRDRDREQRGHHHQHIAPGRPYEYPPIGHLLPEFDTNHDNNQAINNTMVSSAAVFDEPIERRAVGREGHAVPGVQRNRIPKPDPPPHRTQPKNQGPRGNMNVRQMKRRDGDRGPKRPTKLAVQPQPWTVDNFWNRLLGDNSDRRRYGEGIVGRIFGRTLKKKKHLPDHVRKQIDDFSDYRPYFTYWVSTVQLLVAVLSVCLYGFAPFGFFGRTEETAHVLHRTLTMTEVSYLQQENLWLGPRFADLIHLGAKFTPCMRHDEAIYKIINRDRQKENQTACCIYNDKSGCFQSSEQQCPELFARWVKWSVRSPDRLTRRTSGSVCGQHPRACKSPPSIEPYEWKDDITQWPICTEVTPDSSISTMACEITGRPCCIGIHGQCRITTREYCDFVRGYFHEEATLCSQVSCMSEVCGMLPFVNEDKPDQWYRLLSSLFLHAGLIQCAFTLVVQFVIMRDFEKLIGWHRMAMIYILSGMAGYLASASFVPNIPEAGPAGSHFGLLAAMYVDAIYSWHIITKPWKALAQLSGVTLLLFVIGLFPWVDNWAHLFGFIVGMLLSFAVFPYIQFDESGLMLRRLIIVIGSLLVCVLLIVGLFLLFYVHTIEECRICEYFNCLPLPILPDSFCRNQGLDLVPSKSLHDI